MPKDRFSRFKPINWNSDWKKTGNTGSRYNILERKDAYDAYAENAKLKQQITIQKQQKQAPVPAKPKKKLRSPEQTAKIETTFSILEKYLNEWEMNFYNSIMSVPFEISEKQREIIKNMWLKYRNQYFSDNPE
jgi:hypothetical protein